MANDRPVPPVIQRDVTYPIEHVRQHWFPGKRAWLEARKRGLDEHVFYVGTRGFVNGGDLMDELQRQGKKRPSSLTARV